MTSMTVTIEGLESLQARFAAAPETVGDETRRAMTTGLLLFEGTAREKAPKDAGRLGGSITSVITGSGANLTGRVGPSVAYGVVQERGRRPGAKMPPPNALKAWARRHGIPDSALWAVARAIGRRGTKPQRYMEQSYTQNRDKVEKLFERIGQRVVSKLAG